RPGRPPCAWPHPGRSRPASGVIFSPTCGPRWWRSSIPPSSPAHSSSSAAPEGARTRAATRPSAIVRGVPMSVIKPRARGKHVIDHRTRLDQENHETLYAYAAFVDEEPDYVINQLVETVLAKDKEFLAWRTAHPESYAPRRFVRTQRPSRLVIPQTDRLTRERSRDRPRERASVEQAEDARWVRTIVYARRVVAMLTAATACRRALATSSAPPGAPFWGLTQL